MASAVIRLSPVSITTFSPASLNCLNAALLVSLTVSATAIIPSVPHHRQTAEGSFLPTPGCPPAPVPSFAAQAVSEGRFPAGRPYCLPDTVSLNNGAPPRPQERIKGLCLRKDEPLPARLFPQRQRQGGCSLPASTAAASARNSSRVFFFIPQDHIRYRRMPYRDCSCLIQHYRIDGMQGFQAHRRFYEDAVFRRFFPFPP